MVSVIFCVVSVWLVIEPWVKFGTTGTALATVPCKAPRINPRPIASWCFTWDCRKCSPSSPKFHPGLDDEPHRDHTKNYRNHQLDGL